MSTYFYDFISWLIPERLQESKIKFRKAKILTFIQVLSVTVASAMLFAEYFIGITNPVRLEFGVMLGVILLLIFKKTGNLVLSGNLLALSFFLLLIPFIPESGGLISDNLPWLLVAPLIALLFANRWSGFAWTLVLLCYMVYLLVFESDTPIIGHYVEYADIYNYEYYFYSYLVLYSFIMAIVLIFETGQAVIITKLQDQKRQLQAQQLAIAKQTEELQNMQRKLEKSNQELSHFAYTASHDLKEPLRMISNYTKLIERRMRGQLTQETEEFMGYVTNGVGRMDKLLTDLLEYSRFDKKNDLKRDVDLNDTVLMVLSNLMAKMTENEASIETSNLPTIQSNHHEMTQLFQNLISNAIKFKKKDVAPEVKIMHSEDALLHTFEISDNGIGISEENQAKVFKVFERLHSKEEYEGSGIGLATCKKIVEHHGGELKLSSVYGEGTTFTVTIPKQTDSVLLS